MNPLALLRRAVWVVVGPLVVAAVAACNSTNATVLFQTQCAGKTLELQKIVKKNFDNINYSTQLVYGGKAPIILGINELSQSLPYEKAVYSKAPFHRFGFEPQTYEYYGSTLKKLQTVVYIDPKIFSRAEFEALSECLKAHSAKFSEVVGADDKLQQFQIVGTVYGNHVDFVERFTKNAKDWYEVEPDGGTGRTQLDALGIKGMRSESVGGISDVKPGRVIEITDAKEVSLQMLSAYKNADGKTLAERFHIVAEAKKEAKKDTPQKQKAD